MNEMDIKLKVIEFLLKQNKHDIIVPEVSIGHKSKKNSHVRADIFAINGEISIYEIKSEKDNLQRLENQLNNYRLYANKVSVVVAEKFLNLLKLDDSIGIYSYNKNKIIEIRRPLSKKLDINNILEFWLSNELKDFLFGYGGTSKMSKLQCIEYLKELLNNEQLYNATLYMLKQRYIVESNYIKENNTFLKRKIIINSNLTPLKKLNFGILKP